MRIQELLRPNEIQRLGDELAPAQLSDAIFAPKAIQYDPALLFRSSYDGQLGTAGLPNYDVSKDSRRFLMTQSSELNLKKTDVHVIMNWASSLQD